MKNRKKEKEANIKLKKAEKDGDKEKAAKK